MALLVVIGVMTGFDQDLKKKILSVNAHVILIKPGYASHDARRWPSHPGGGSAKPFIYTQVMVSGPGNISGGVIRGLDLPDLRGGPPAVEVRAAVLQPGGSPGRPRGGPGQ